MVSQATNSHWLDTQYVSTLKLVDYQKSLTARMPQKRSQSLNFKNFLGEHAPQIPR